MRSFFKRSLARLLQAGKPMLLLFSLMLSCSLTFAKQLHVRLSLDITNQPLESVFKTMEEKSGYAFWYKHELLRKAKPVTIKTVNEEMLSILDKILKNEPLAYEVNDKVIAIREKELPVQENLRQSPSQVPVSGNVKTENGEPVIGTTVKNKNGTAVTTTDVNGHFAIKAAVGDVLVLSSIGFQTTEVEVKSGETLAIVMKVSQDKLSEVVVVGYGTQKRANLTGAVATVTYDKALENRPITNPSQALAGKVSGVFVSQNSGSPGSDGATIRVRGYGTLNNTDPLVLIDGVEGRMAELNPADIASITILKDAASSAIYGSRAANGVVLVTTKKGSYNSDPTLSYNGYYGFQQLGRKYDRVTNSVELMKAWNQAVANNGGDPIFPQQVIDDFSNNNDPYLYPNTDFYKEIYRTAPITEHNVSVRGGSAKQNYYLSANYLSQDGIIKQTDSKRYGINFSLNNKVKDWLEIGGRVQITRKETNSPYDGISRVYYIMSNGAYPFIAPYTSDGRFGATQALKPNGSPIVDSRNPLPDLYNGRSQYMNNFFRATLNATANITKDLTFKTMFTGQSNNNRQDRYNQMNYVYTAAGQQDKVLDYPTQISPYRGNNEEFYWVYYNTLNYTKTISQVHNIGAIIGMQSESYQLKKMTAQKSNPPKSGLNEVDAGTSNVIASGNTTEWSNLGYFGRINYNYREKYLVEGNLRADASSRFREGNRWGYFPSVSVGWAMEKEGFIRNIAAISQLKLRASWGQLGNQNINNDYPYIAALTQSNSTSYTVGGQLAPGAAIVNLVDPNISWETTTSTDIGLDVGLFDNALSFELDYFNKNTNDILVQLPISATMGDVSAPIQNIGQMNNKGFELSVNYRSPEYKSGISYSIGANVSHIKNMVTRFRKDAPDQLWLIREGQPYKMLYGFKFDGIFQSDKEASDYMHANGYTPKAGDIKYEDVNGDGKLDFNDKQALGNTLPTWTYGLTLNVNYKRWSLNVVTQGMAGVNGYNQSAWTQPLGISGGSLLTRWRGAWTPENHSNTLPRIRVNDTWNRYESSFWVQNMSYLKIKNIQLLYQLPEAWLHAIHFKSASVYANVQNLPSFTSKGYIGFDPEQNTFDNGGGVYPTPVIATFGINLQL
ncbi:TonB-linked outer membrane protein, SusC/RagA family [Chitinophaga jiangningensis]|uniref:TonB-linked outer membrane protein, SusC/RagA family n=1 Tax=Chitinophaga jiangningensis TaxID=1419482 RepID=A0A1M7CL60_9BACT|nr:TonB-dependent receptor [Chitinophaga jiangningensis]SHL67883.1 TonB-linked outer membrane protein, SusC/RagA family [Chitinophaga jiangningensis]